MSYEVKHTPGPWPESGPVLKSMTVRGASKEAAANRRLIAAAPELLEALKQAVFVLEGEDDSDSAELGRFRAAIAKAEGES